MKLIQSLQPIPELKPITSQIPLLKMNNQPPKVLYETVGKLAGINVLFDPQFQAGRNANLDLTNVTLDEALDYIALLTKTFWKPVSSNAIFVTEDNVTKRRDYQDEVVKVFYLKNPTSVQEFQEIVTAVRSVSDVRRMFTYNAQNAVMVRDTVDKVALVEKLFHDMDKPKAEVVIDVVVMEANSDHLRNIASTLVSGTTNGLVLPITFSRGAGTTTSGGMTTTTSGSIALSQLGKISTNDFTTTLPGALLQAVMSDNSTKVMQSPEVRASDGQKVSLKIGDKVPYATGSFQPGIGSVGVSPLVSTQFQFAETGVNVEVTPHVHGSDELTMHVLVDISNVSRNVNIGGLDQPVISQRKNEADIRVKDGEVSLLGGLMQTQDTNTVTGIPGLTNIPVLGRFFLTGNTRDKVRGELLIALIPHIVRTPDITGLDMRGIAAGTDQEVKLTYGRTEPEAPAAAQPAQPGAPAPVPPVSAIPTQPAAPVVTTPAPTQPAQAAPPPAQQPTPAVTPPAQPPAQQQAAPAAPAAPGAASITLVPVSVQAQLGAPVVISLQANNISDLAAVPVKLKWDPKVLSLNRVTPAALLTKDGQVNPATLDIRNDAGEATVEISRTAGAPGVSGTGPVMQFTFSAVGKGPSAITVTEVHLRNSKQQPIAATAPSAAVNVQ